MAYQLHQDSQIHTEKKLREGKIKYTNLEKCI